MLGALQSSSSCAATPFFLLPPDCSTPLFLHPGHNVARIMATAGEVGPALHAALANAAKDPPRYMKLAKDWCDTPDNLAKMGCVLLIDKLIDISSADQETSMITRFWHHLSMIIKQMASRPFAAPVSPLDMANPVNVLERAVRALGHLTRSSPPSTTAVFVDFEVKRALEWIQQGKDSNAATGGNESRRHAATLILRELAKNAPTLFYVHVNRPFFETLWSAIKDPKTIVRNDGARALSAVLFLVCQREPKQSTKWLRFVYDLAREGFNAGQPETVHGALLTFNELLHEHTGTFMVTRFNEVSDQCVLRFRDNKDKLVRRTVIALMPRLANFCPHKKIDDYLDTCMQHMMKCLRRKGDSATAYRALGTMAMNVGKAVTPYLESIVLHIIDELNAQSTLRYRHTRGRDKHPPPLCKEALVCIAMLAQADAGVLRRALKEHASNLLAAMFGTPCVIRVGGLSAEYIDALSMLGRHVPSQMQVIRSKLMQLLSLLLGYRDPSFASETDAAAAAAAVSEACGAFTSLPSFWIWGGGVHDVYASRESFTGSRNAMHLLWSAGQPATCGSRHPFVLRVPSSPWAFAGSARSVSTPPSVGLRQRGLAAAAGQQAAKIHCEIAQGLDGSNSLLHLALITLATFDFRGMPILPIVRGCAVLYLGHDSPNVRVAAVAACALGIFRVLGDEASAPCIDCGAFPAVSTQTGLALSPLDNQLLSVREEAIHFVVERLMICAVADTDAELRLLLLTLLSKESRMDAYLIQAENLRSLFLVLNDEHASVRHHAMVIVGRLAQNMPTLVLPNLLFLLVRLLRDLSMEFNGGHSGSGMTPKSDTDLEPEREASAELLVWLIAASGRLMKSHIGSIMEVLLPHLQDSNAAVATAAMAGIGSLACIGGSTMAHYVPQVMSVMLECFRIQSHASFDRQEIVLRTLTQIMRCTAHVKNPYVHRSMRLLDHILHLLIGQGGQRSPWSLRRQAMVALGVLGALDPFKYKQLRRLDRVHPCSLKALVGTASTNVLLGSVVHARIRRNNERTTAQDNVDTPSDERNHDDCRVMFVAPRFPLIGRWKLAQDCGGTHRRFTVLREMDKPAPSRIPSPVRNSSSSHSLLDEEMNPGSRNSDMMPSNPMYYPSVALSELMNILSDVNLPMHHKSVVQASVIIFRCLGRSSNVEFLPQILPQILDVMQAPKCDARLRGFIFQQLSKIVEVVGGGIRRYLARILEIAKPYWGHGYVFVGGCVPFKATLVSDAKRFGHFAPSNNALLADMCRNTVHASVSEVGSISPFMDGIKPPPHGPGPTTGAGDAVSYLEHISTFICKASAAMGEQFMPYLPDILPPLLNVLYTGKDIQSITVALRAIDALAPLLDEYICVFLPALASVIERSKVSVIVRVRACQSLWRICRVVDTILDISPRIVHPLVRTLSQSFRSLSTDVAAPIDDAMGSNADVLPLVRAVVEALITVVYRLGTEYLVYAALVARTVDACPEHLLQDARHVLDRYNGAVAKLLHGEALGTVPWVCIVRNAGEGECPPLGLCGMCAAGRIEMATGMLWGDISDSRIRRDTRGVGVCGTSDRGGMGGINTDEVARISGSGVGDEPILVNTGTGDEIGAIVGSRNVRGGGRHLQTGAIGADTFDTDGAGFSAVYFAQSLLTKQELNKKTLKQAWDASQRSTAEDWLEWMRRFSLCLLQQSPSPALRSCASLAMAYHPLARRLFNAAFVSCWRELDDNDRSWLVQSLETAFISVNTPPSLLQTLLNLAEFMEHVDDALPIDIRTLGKLAEKCHAYAKALHYKELEFHTSPETCIESLISINNQLEQPDAAVGILEYAHKHHSSTSGSNVVDLRPSWYEKLGRYEDALQAYRRSRSTTIEDTLGQLRCLTALGEWQQCARLVGNKWDSIRAETGDIGGGWGGRKHQECAHSLYCEPRGSAEVAELTQRRHWARGQDVGRYDKGIGQPPGRSTLSLPVAYFAAFGGLVVSGELTSATLPAMRVLRHGPSATSRAPSLRTCSAVPMAATGNAVHESRVASKVALLGARAAWALGCWDEMAMFTMSTDVAEPDGCMMRAVLEIHRGQFEEAQHYVDLARQVIEVTLAPQIKESYNRAYAALVTLQQLAELEEIVGLKRLCLAGRCSTEWRMSAEDCRSQIHTLWKRRMSTVQQDVFVLLPLLAVHTLVYDPLEDLGAWLNFVRVCRKRGHLQLSLKALMNLGVATSQMGRVAAYSPRGDIVQRSSEGVRTACGHNGRQSCSLRVVSSLGGVRNVASCARTPQTGAVLLPAVCVQPSQGTQYSSHASSEAHVHSRVAFAYVKHLWAVGARQTALLRLRELAASLEAASSAPAINAHIPERHAAVRYASLYHVMAVGEISHRAQRKHYVPGSSTTPRSRAREGELTNLLVHCYVKLGDWHLSMHEDTPSVKGRAIAEVQTSYQWATDLNPLSYKAWHAWALTNFQAVEHFQRESEKRETLPGYRQLCVQAADHLVPAVHGFFRSIKLGQHVQANVLQDILRLLTLWFAHGSRPDVMSALQKGFNSVSTDTWLDVTPQLIARISKPHDLISGVLLRVGTKHPQVLIYPLTVASNSSARQRREAAMHIMSQMRRHSGVVPRLVDQASLVSRELIRVAVLWHELWHEHLENASRMYFGNADADSMIATLAPLHATMEFPGPRTLCEVATRHKFCRYLMEAKEWTHKFKVTGNAAALHQAWDLYYAVFKRISRQMAAKSLELQFVSPRLLAARDLELAVPGTYSVNLPVVHIRSFGPSLAVITSKQRPRKIVVHGSDGRQYQFLLKGHEDLRLDERVMQLFGLVNTLLSQDPETSKSNVGITRYAVIPLSSDVGIVGWVPGCDTLHQLVQEYREARGIPLNIEQQLIRKVAGNQYDKFTLLQKVEIFSHALSSTSGQDLYKVLWLKSANSELWLDRRANYTRSLATMSMVGYVLGLGDRHPSNLMIARSSGRIVHIDFGDCFEVAMHRDQFPEKVPFRLTRMLVSAMEASGIEGSYRFTCESVLRVLRDNHDSVMTMLEAFVHDPLISWRLVVPAASGAVGDYGGTSITSKHQMSNIAAVQGEIDEEATGKMHSLRHGCQRDTTNNRAIVIVERIRSKLKGTTIFEGGERGDNADGISEGVKVQVDRLIKEAMSHENLVSMYAGWCSFW